MKRNVQDISMQSAQPNFPLTGGGYYNQAAFLGTPNIERFEASVLDNRPVSSPTIPIGTLYVEQFLAANTGDANYVPSSIPQQQIPLFSYGILQAVPLPPSGGSAVTAFAPAATGIPVELNLVQKGNAQALCTTLAAAAIAPGTLLVADGNGNLTPSLLATAVVVPTVTTTPTVVQVAGATAGTTTYTYTISSAAANGVAAAASAGGSVTTGNAVLSTINGNKITWTAVAGVAYYIINRTVGGATQGFVGTSNNPVAGFVDYGIVATPYTQQTTANLGSAALPGTVLAVSKGTLAASTTTPTLVLVNLGGF